MVLLYDRVLLEKIIFEELTEGVLKHFMSHDNRIEKTSAGVVKHIGRECEEVSVGDIVLYPTALERYLDIGEEKKLVEIRESQLLGILPPGVKFEN